MGVIHLDGHSETGPWSAFMCNCDELFPAASNQTGE